MTNADEYSVLISVINFDDARRHFEDMKGFCYSRRQESAVSVQQLNESRHTSLSPIFQTNTTIIAISIMHYHIDIHGLYYRRVRTSLPRVRHYYYCFLAHARLHQWPRAYSRIIREKAAITLPQLRCILSFIL